MDSFRLIESMLWTKGEGYYLLELHFERLRDSCGHFGFECPAPAIRAGLEQLTDSLDPALEYKVRMLLSRDGQFDLSHAEIAAAQSAALPRVSISETTVDSGDVFLYHKTTNRGLYDRQLEACGRLGLYDMVFMNERGELTEGARNNVVLKIGSELFTPPVECGLLDGVCRRMLVGQGAVAEKVLFRRDLGSADSIFMCNSVRGLVQVELV